MHELGKSAVSWKPTAEDKKRKRCTRSWRRCKSNCRHNKKLQRRKTRLEARSREHSAQVDLEQRVKRLTETLTEEVKLREGAERQLHERQTSW